MQVDQEANVDEGDVVDYRDYRLFVIAADNILKSLQNITKIPIRFFNFKYLSIPEADNIPLFSPFLPKEGREDFQLHFWRFRIRSSNNDKGFWICRDAI